MRYVIYLFATILISLSVFIWLLVTHTVPMLIIVAVILGAFYLFSAPPDRGEESRQAVLWPDPREILVEAPKKKEKGFADVDASIRPDTGDQLLD